MEPRCTPLACTLFDCRDDLSGLVDAPDLEQRQDALHLPVPAKLLIGRDRLAVEQGERLMWSLFGQKSCCLIDANLDGMARDLDVLLREAQREGVARRRAGIRWGGSVAPLRSGARS